MMDCLFGKVSVWRHHFFIRNKIIKYLIYLIDISLFVQMSEKVVAPAYGKLSSRARAQGGSVSIILQCRWSESVMIGVFDDCHQSIPLLHLSKRLGYKVTWVYSQNDFGFVQLSPYGRRQPDETEIVLGVTLGYAQYKKYNIKPWPFIQQILKQ